MAEAKEGAGLGNAKGVDIDAGKIGDDFKCCGYGIGISDFMGYSLTEAYSTASAHMIGYNQYGSSSLTDRLNEYCHYNETPTSYLGLTNTAEDEFKRYRERVYNRVYNLKKKNKGFAYMCN